MHSCLGLCSQPLMCDFLRALYTGNIPVLLIFLHLLAGRLLQREMCSLFIWLTWCIVCTGDAGFSFVFFCFEYHAIVDFKLLDVLNTL